jgi:CrcB protein
VTAVGIALLGALGAVLRHAMGHWAARRGGWPRGTELVNVSGSLVAGLVIGAGLSQRTLAVLVVGFCGGFTTFSTWSVEVVELAEEPARTWALLYATGTAVACVGAAWLGIALVR